MPSEPIPPADGPEPTPAAKRARRIGKIVLYALLYASAVALLVVFAPSGPHVFIYQEF
jgi:hypothetical protein